MSDGRFKAVDFKETNRDALRGKFRGQTLVVTTDVAKKVMYTGLSSPQGELERLVTWEHPSELERFVEWIESLGATEIQLVIEPSGTYGEPLREKAYELGWGVYLVSPKRLHDAAEVFDGVPSLHDAKAAWLLAKLHAQHLSEPWGKQEPEKRQLAAYTKTMARYGDDKQRHLGRLEAQLARYWPEVTRWLAKDSATLLALLEEFGGPEGIAASPDRARQLMRTVSRGLVAEEKLDRVVESADQTHGQAMLEAEKEALAALARHIDDCRRKEREWKSKIGELVDSWEDTEAIGEVVGKPTAAVLRTEVGDFREFDSPDALLKHAGLNLKEKSSGKHQGELKITKRGSSMARKYLYWATLRMLQESRVFRAWHERKVERDGGIRGKSVVALMRKLLKGLWHVSRGKRFDAAKLFDLERLGLQPH